MRWGLNSKIIFLFETSSIVTDDISYSQWHESLHPGNRQRLQSKENPVGTHAKE